MSKKKEKLKGLLIMLFYLFPQWNKYLVYVTAPHLVLDPEYTTEIHRIAAAEPLAHEGKKK